MKDTWKIAKWEVMRNLTNKQFIIGLLLTPCEWHNKMERLGVRTKTWTYKSGGSPCIPTRNE